jgi:hypothetical protein
MPDWLAWVLALTSIVTAARICDPALSPAQRRDILAYARLVRRKIAACWQRLGRIGDDLIALVPNTNVGRLVAFGGSLTVSILAVLLWASILATNSARPATAEAGSLGTFLLIALATHVWIDHIIFRVFGSIERGRLSRHRTPNPIAIGVLFGPCIVCAVVFEIVTVVAAASLVRADLLALQDLAYSVTVLQHVRWESWLFPFLTLVAAGAVSARAPLAVAGFGVLAAALLLKLSSLFAALMCASSRRKLEKTYKPLGRLAATAAAIAGILRALYKVLG